LYFCCVIGLGCFNRTDLVKWSEFIHNYLIYNYKVAKNPPLDQIFVALILLNVKEISIGTKHYPRNVTRHKITEFLEEQGFLK
jgi:hypothetical protein